MGYNDCVTGRRGVHQDDDVNVNEDKVKVNNNDVKVNDSDADVSDGKDSTCVCLTRVYKVEAAIHSCNVLCYTPLVRYPCCRRCVGRETDSHPPTWIYHHAS